MRISGQAEHAGSRQLDGTQVGCRRPPVRAALFTTIIKRLPEDITVREQHDAEGLILGQSSHFALYRRMGEKLSDLALSHFLRVAFFAERI